MRYTQFITLKVKTGVFFYANSIPNHDWVERVGVLIYDPDKFKQVETLFPIGDNYPCVGAGSYFIYEKEEQ